MSLYHGLVIFFGILMLYPLLWLMFGSLKPSEELFHNPGLFTANPTLENFKRGWAFDGNTSFGTYFYNSTFYSVVATIGAVLVSSLTAYGFTRIKFAGNKFWYTCMFLTLMLPFQVIMVPQFILFHRLGWTQTAPWLPLIVPQFGGQAFFIFMMVQFYRTIPFELDQSAMIDGCNKFTIYSRILFPLIKPALVTSAIFSFYWRWDDFLGPLLYLQRPHLRTVTLALRSFQDMVFTDWGALFAMGTASILPSLIIFFLGQKYIVEGIATTGLKS